jgi:hypothetical protein
VPLCVWAEIPGDTPAHWSAAQVFRDCCSATGSLCMHSLSTRPHRQLGVTYNPVSIREDRAMLLKLDEQIRPALDCWQQVLRRVRSGDRLFVEARHG